MPVNTRRFSLAATALDLPRFKNVISGDAVALRKRVLESLCPEWLPCLCAEEPSTEEPLSDSLCAALCAREAAWLIEDPEGEGRKTLPEPGSRLATVFDNFREGPQSTLPLAFGHVPDAGLTELPSSGTGNSAEERSFYSYILQAFEDGASDCLRREDPAQVLLSLSENLFSRVPLCGGKARPLSFSLHQQLTAALTGCYLSLPTAGEHGDARSECASLLKERNLFLYSMDVSGIQSFIYTITSKGALRTLRARSFYLEILMEHAIDVLLERLSLTRANLLYSGGGHCYLLLPSTPETLSEVAGHRKELNTWLMERFGVSLYVAGAGVTCSASELADLPAGSYVKLFRGVSAGLSEVKSHRYDAEEIRALNARTRGGQARECTICHRADAVNDEGVCALCEGLMRFSPHIIRDDFFVVLKGAGNAAPAEDGPLGSGTGRHLPLPFDSCLCGADYGHTAHLVKGRQTRRVYTKNRMFLGDFTAQRLWVGDYQDSAFLKDYGDDAKGIRRLGCFRADVDSLGATFAQGPLPSKAASSLAHTLALSGALSRFFKHDLNALLKDPRLQILGRDGPEPVGAAQEPSQGRHLSIIYSGGDDLFLLGAWQDVLEGASDLARAFREYTRGTLTLSGGFGLFKTGYPVSGMALFTEDLVENSKLREGKNALTVLENGYRFTWEEFERNVLEEQYRPLKSFLECSTANAFGGNTGKALLYRLMELLRTSGPLNRVRFLYTLSRLEPPAEAGEETRERWLSMARRLQGSYEDPVSRKALLLSLCLYLYAHRETTEGENH